jgi:hypothetical protein
MVVADLPFTESQRHYSHLFALYPLYVINPENSADPLNFNSLGLVIKYNRNNGSVQLTL